MINVSNVTHIYMVSQLVCSLRYSHTSNPFLITPIERVQHAPKGAPAAVRTRLGWALQGPTSLGESSNPTQCLFTSHVNPYNELKRQVELLWQLDTLPFLNEKLITRSNQDKEAIALLNAKGAFTPSTFPTIVHENSVHENSFSSDELKQIAFTPK